MKTKAQVISYQFVRNVTENKTGCEVALICVLLESEFNDLWEDFFPVVAHEGCFTRDTLSDLLDGVSSDNNRLTEFLNATGEVNFQCFDCVNPVEKQVYVSIDDVTGKFRYQKCNK
ncbi:MAG: hypothetical protein IKE69_11530 [Thermoguttaceae bacterium]|nr:hypothetical protein [Thermoguttaceae bacterium]